MPDIEETIRGLYEARARHRQRIEQIEQALELLGSSDVDEELFAMNLPRPTGIREAVIAVLEERAGEQLDVATLLTETLARGWRSTSLNPRNTLASTLAKLADSGEIERSGRGRYRSKLTEPELAVA